MADDLKRVGLIFKEDGAVNFRKSLQEVSIEMNKNYNQFKLTQSQWDNSTKSTEKLKAQQEYLTNAIEIQSDKVSVLRRQLEEMENAENKDTTAIKKKQNELTNAEIKLKNYEKQLSDVNKKLSDFGEKMIDAGEKVQKAGAKIESAGKKVSTFSTIATAGLAGTVATVANFEDAMRQVSATMGITADEIANGSESYKILEDAAKQCGETTKYSASEAAEALNYLALAGYDAQKSAEVLPKILNLAAAGNLDLATASDMVTDAMAALNMEAKDLDKYIDEMAKTSQKSNTSVAQLGEATLTCAGTVKMAGMSLETMNAELGILANNGIKGAEGGTHLRNIILSLTSPTDVAAKALKNLGIKVTDSSGNIRDMNDIMADFNKKLDGMSDEKKTNVISQIFNKTDISAVNALIKGSGEEFENLKKEISNCNGTAQDMADTMNSSLKGQLTLVKSQLEAIAIKLGNKLMPIVKDCVKKISDLATWFSNLNDKQTKTILAITEIVAAAGPLLTIVGKITSLLGGGIKTIGVVTQAIRVMRGVITSTSTAVNGLVTVFSVMNPVTLIAVAGITALSVAAYKYAQNQNSAKKEAEEFTQKVTDSKQALDDYNKSIEDSANAEVSHIEYVSKLKDELIQLTDENGKVKEGYEGRVSFILNEMNKALGTEYKLNGDVIDSYKNLRAEIDKTIEKKKAEILLNAEEEEYKNAIENQTEAVKQLNEAQNKLGMSYDTAKQKVQDWKDAMHEAVQNQDSDAISSLSIQGKQIEVLKEKMKAYETAESTVKTYTDKVKQYETDYANFVEGNYEQIGQSIINSTKTWSDSSVDVIKNSIKTQSKELEQYKEIYERTGNEVASQSIQQAQQNLQALANELANRTTTIGTLGEDEIKAWQTLAIQSNEVYSQEISKMSPEMQTEIQRVTGIIAGNTTIQYENGMMAQRGTSDFAKNNKISVKMQEEINATANVLNSDTSIKAGGEREAGELNTGFNRNVDGHKWGSDLVENIVGGLTGSSALGKLAGAASRVAGTIASYIHHSVPDEGPLADELEYMPDMIDNLVKTLYKASPKLEKATSDVAGMMSDNLGNVDADLNIGNSNNAKKINYSNTIDYNKLSTILTNSFLTALNKCKLTLDEDGFARIVKDELYKVV